MSSFGIETITFHNTLTVADEIGLDVQFRARAEREGEYRPLARSLPPGSSVPAKFFSHGRA